MKCLSLLQPWASLVVLGAKRCETRTWATRHRGLLAIHASRRFPEELRALCGREPFRRLLREAGFQSWFDLPVGAILGTVHVLGCVPAGEVIGLDAVEQALGDYAPGRYAWLLARPATLPTPIPHRGMRGIFDISD